MDLFCVIYTESQAFMWKYLCWPCKIPSFLVRGTKDEVPLNTQEKKKHGVKRRSGGTNGTSIPSTTTGTYATSKTDNVASMQSVADGHNDKDDTPEPNYNAQGEIIYTQQNAIIIEENQHPTDNKSDHVPSLIIPATHKIQSNNSESTDDAAVAVNVNPTDTPIS